MKKYNIKLTEEAKQERKSLAHFIKDEVHAPLTADEFIAQMEPRIRALFK